MGLFPLVDLPTNLSHWNAAPECIVVQDAPMDVVQYEPRAYISLIQLIMFVSFHIVSHILMYQHRGLFPLTKRDNGLVALSSLASLSSCYNTLYRDVYGLFMYSCDEYLPHAIFWLPVSIVFQLGLMNTRVLTKNQKLQVGPTLLRLVNIRNRVLFNLKKNKLNVNSFDAKAIQMLLKVKLKTNKSYTIVLAIGIMTPSLILVTYSYVTQSKYFAGCVGCFLTPMETNFLGLCGVIEIISGLVLLRRLKNIKPDLVEYGEIKRVLSVSLVFGATYCITILLGADGKNYNLATPLNLIGVYMTYHTCLLPVLSSRKRVRIRKQAIAPSSSGGVTSNGRTGMPKELINILETVEGLASITEHLTMEYNVENVKFWFDAVSWRRDYNLNRCSKKELIDRAFNIYQAYVPESALLQVNLDNSQRVRLDEAFKNGGKSNQELVPVETFDEAVDEIYGLMVRDCFPRYKQSPLYQDFVENVWQDAEEW